MGLSSQAMLSPCRVCRWFQEEDSDVCVDCGAGSPDRALHDSRKAELSRIHQVERRAAEKLPSLDGGAGCLVFLAGAVTLVLTVVWFDLGFLNAVGVAVALPAVAYFVVSWWLAKRRAAAAREVAARGRRLEALLDDRSRCLRAEEKGLKREAERTLERLAVTRDAVLKNEKISDEDRAVVGEARQQLIRRAVEELGTQQEQHALRLYIDASRWANGLERFRRLPLGTRAAREEALRFLDKAGHEGEHLLQRVDRTLWPGYWSDGTMAIQELVSKIRRIEQHLLKEGVNEVLTSDHGPGDEKPVFDTATGVEPLSASAIPRPGRVKVSVVIESLVQQITAADGEAISQMDLKPHGWQGQLGYYMGLPGFTA